MGELTPEEFTDNKIEIPEILPGFNVLVNRIEDLERKVDARLRYLPTAPKPISKIYNEMGNFWADHISVRFNPMIVPDILGEKVQNSIRRTLSGNLRTDASALLKGYKEFYQQYKKKENPSGEQTDDWDTLLRIHTIVHWYEKIFDINFLAGNTGLAIGLHKFHIDGIRDTIEGKLTRLNHEYVSQMKTSHSDGEFNILPKYSTQMSLVEFSEKYKDIIAG